LGKRRFSIAEPALIALESLRAHKLRSFLTLFGVIIAVATLIAVVSAVEGLNSYVAERIGNFGPNVFYVTRYGIITNVKDWFEARRRNRKLTIEDYLYLREHLTLAEDVGAQDWREFDVRAGNESLEEVTIRGATPNIIDIGTNKVAAGRFFTEGEYQRRSLVAFLGTDIRDKLYPNVEPLGKWVVINGVPFEIIGVADTVGSAFGQSQDNFIYIPLPTLWKIWGEGSTEESGAWVAVKCRAPELMEQTKDQARALMRARRQQKYDEKDAFGILSSESVTSLWNEIFGGLATASVGVVSIFLVIGGIVIMNIMLASVTERTREIGIRKSLGARRRDILLQFLVESSVMSAVGGLLGVAGAFAITGLVLALTPMPMRTPASAVVLAIGVSSAVGLFFGLWPAFKAARLDPVVALRYE
jgi:putative ABC transport system permease protein